ncbi:transcription termination factor MTEF18, mitochondrial-like [Ipomoea triloba]|uniref:transcription termination factor MTEF18, mitochondrial-like n=1 Tax=Ipomoea triloba TaxID=35885 RepID=UPI00125D1F38|nr:transcription termination factor MTEF18, mitochondrial-like [Ipomoea triloba]
MTHLQKPRVSPLLKWVSSFFDNHFGYTSPTLWLSGSARSTRFYRTKKNAPVLEKTPQFPLAVRQEAQAALTEYLHSTRSLPFSDAEHISRNSPHFLESLLKRVNPDKEVSRSVVRFLRYHPINEFEPFFESVGLSPSEYSPFLPPKMMFLNDDKLLMENYHVLCNYGVARNEIGNIYKEAPEVFRYSSGLLKLKLQSFEEVGLHRVTVAKIVCLSPHLLTGNESKDFFTVLEKLKSAGVEAGTECEWIQGQISKGNAHNWRCVCEAMCMFCKLGFSEEKLRKIICQNPELLFEASGHTTFLLIGFLLKFGYAPHDMQNVFLQIPKHKVGQFVRNLRSCYIFLVEIDMHSHDIGNIVRSHAVLLGSCSLKKAVTLLTNLRSGKKRICKMILTDPHVLKKWVVGLRVEPLQPTEDDLNSNVMKTKFLLSLGFVENSSEMEEALKAFRGKGLELQERYDCLVNSGLKPKEVAKMVKVAPHILNQSKEHIEAKIDFLINTLGYPVSSLVAFPYYISYTFERSTLRLSMYNWLKERGRVRQNLALSTLIACSDKIFLKTYVNPHPGGLYTWEKLKKQVYPD